MDLARNAPGVEDLYVVFEDPAVEDVIIWYSHSADSALVLFEEFRLEDVSGSAVVRLVEAIGSGRFTRRPHSIVIETDEGEEVF